MVLTGNSQFIALSVRFLISLRHLLGLPWGRRMFNRRQFSTAVFSAFALNACGGTTSESASRSSASPIAEGSTIQRAAGGFRFTEGPAADRTGNIFFSDLSRSRIHRFSVTGNVSTFRSNSGGANGLMFDKQGNLIVCESNNRRVTSISPSGRVSILADRYLGRRFNSPNDLWIDPRGGIYFSDPSLKSQQTEQDGAHVYYISPDRRTVKRVTNDLVNPNGLIGAADGTRLYVADPGAGRTYVYRIDGEANLGGRRTVTNRGSDGMTLDGEGNLYITGETGVMVFNTRNRRIATLDVPEIPTNVTFGGQNRQTLFITAGTGLYTVQMRVRGQA